MSKNKVFHGRPGAFRSAVSDIVEMECWMYSSRGVASCELRRPEGLVRRTVAVPRAIRV